MFVSLGCRLCRIVSLAAPPEIRALLLSLTRKLDRKSEQFLSKTMTVEQGQPESV